MALTPGDRISHYEILGVLGRGGMGEVYRARDPKLDREVAIKVLSPQFARDPDRLARFEREAKVLAALNHPNIATIYGREDSAIVMELVEGTTLADRLKSGALPLEETIAIAQQIIAALEAAHDKGVVHRDLKPSNIKAPLDATAKVLDFGLATAIQAGSRDPSEHGSDSPTLTMGATAAGTIMGTAAYMSPEQAAGKPVDKRADIWSFGVVLWEMLTGQRLFTGESVSHILADVLRAPIEFEKVPAGPLRQLLQRCLDRDVKTRLRDIGEARIALARATDPAPPPPALVETRKPFVWIGATAAMTALAAIALWGWLKPAPAETRPVVHFVTATPLGLGLMPVAVSPDGSRVAFASASLDHLYTRTMDEPIARPIPGTEGGRFPVFSPDGQWLAFYTGAGPFQLKKIPLAGGAALTLASGLQDGTPLSWGEDGYLLLPGPTIRRLPELGGEPASISGIDPAKGEISYTAPQLLPGGAYILAGLINSKGGIAELPILAIDAKTGERKVLIEGAGDARFVPSGSRPGLGHLVYARDGFMFGAAFDANTLRVGPAAPVLEGMRNVAAIMPAGFSRSGVLAFPTGAGTASLVEPVTLTWVDRQGNEKPLLSTPRAYANPRVSPNGLHVAVNILELVPSLDLHLWLLDLTRGTLARRTFDRANANPAWTPDSKQIIFGSAVGVLGLRRAIASVVADGSGQPVTLIPEGTPPPFPHSVSPDGTFVIGTSGNDVWALPLGGDPKSARPQPFLDNRFARGEFQFSPDGKWVAYQSTESGRNEVYVSPFPGPGGKSQVSTEGGTQPRWNRNGRELFFRNGAKMMAVDTELAPAFRAGTPKMLFEKVSSDYDVHPDGKRFIILKPTAVTADGGELHVILNWFEDLRKKVPLDK